MFFFLWIFLCNDHFCLQEKGLIVVCSRLSRQRSWHLSQAESSEFFEKQGSIWPLLAQKASPGAVAWGWRTGRWSLAAHRCSSLPLSLSGLCVGPSCSVCCFSECNRQGVLADRAVNCSFYLGCPGRRTPGKKDSASAMGQLCCFPLAREEEKISKCDSYCAESRVWLFSAAVL